ncbi:MAG TPA: DUF192 domain-containing protein, partial [Usitatibacter sp.]|nr:DUF192 domain-containing protein [Usitatibacter sp.]
MSAIKNLRGASALLLAALALSAAHALAAGAAALKTMHVTVGSHPLKVELAVSDAERSKGLMFRKSLGKDDGMLFVFDEPAYHSMWMKDTLIPLSVAFLDGDGVILNIVDMEPQTLDPHSAAGPARYAIEANKGWFAE